MQPEPSNLICVGTKMWYARCFWHKLSAYKDIPFSLHSSSFSVPVSKFECTHALNQLLVTSSQSHLILVLAIWWRRVLHPIMTMFIFNKPPCGLFFTITLVMSVLIHAVTILHANLQFNIIGSLNDLVKFVSIFYLWSNISPLFQVSCDMTSTFAPH
jgi:hypothetical protein